MPDSDDLTLWCTLNQLIADYWADVDEGGGQKAHEFYLPDGFYEIGNNRFEGREKIRAFYTRRRYATIVTRHLVCNVRVRRQDEEHAQILGLMSLYRADGKSPFQGARPPAMIADFEALCVLRDNWSWRFQSHVLRPFIVSGDLPASISIRLQAL